MEKKPKEELLLIIFTILLFIPFLSKAFHIDDTLFLWCAQQIQKNPLDFFGFTANWYGSEIPMYIINQNPPGVSYYIALVTSIFGYDEAALHLAFIIVSISFCLGTYYLAQYLCKSPFQATLFCLFSPIFVVSATNVMSDVMMMSFYVWAIKFWLQGLKENSQKYLFISVILITGAQMTKYFGMTCIPLLFFYTIITQKKLDTWVLFLLLPISFLIAFEIYTSQIYGNCLILNAVKYSIPKNDLSGLETIKQFITGLSFNGGGMVGAFFIIPLLWRKKHWPILLGILLTILFILFALEYFDFFNKYNSPTKNWLRVLHLSLFVFTGCCIFSLVIKDLLKNKNSESVLLFCWIFSTFIFSVFINWTVNARTMLPMLPAVGIILLRTMSQNIDLNNRSFRLLLYLLLIPGIVLSLLVTNADMSYANCQRVFAEKFKEEYEGYSRKIWFQGHWGFQYYMEKNGAMPMNFSQSNVTKGDLLVIPRYNTNTKLPKADQFKFIAVKNIPSSKFLSTINPLLDAGFYTDKWGILPYSFGKVKPEEYLLFLAVQ